MASTNSHRTKLSQYLTSQRAKTSTALSTGLASKEKSTSHRSPNSSRLKLPQIKQPQLKRTTSIEDLPDEILSLIFWKLPVGDLITVSRVCKRFYMIEGDNLLWQRLYARFAGPLSDEKESEIPTCDLLRGCWKNLCLKRCKVKRDAIFLKEWKRPDSYTGLRQRPETTLGKVGVKFELTLFDNKDMCHTLEHSDLFWSTMSLTVRWYSLVFPNVSSIRGISIHALSPLMFYGPTRPAKDGIFQKSLLLCNSLNVKNIVSRTNSLGSDNHVKLYALDMGLLLATYKVDGEIAFITVTFHNHNFVSRCLSGHTERMWEQPELKSIEDDIDSSHGLHGYSCILLLRNMRQKLLEFKSTSMHCPKDKICDGFASFVLVKRDDKNYHVAALKDFSFPWKTGLFKGIIKDVCILDMTLLDSWGRPFWTISTAVQIKQSAQTDQFEFNSSSYRAIEYSDDIGKLYLEIGKLEEGNEYLTYFTVSLSLDVINKVFVTEYK